MTKIIGRLKAFGVGIEKSTARGTAVLPQYWYPFLDLSFNPKSNKIVNTSARGRIEDADSADIAEIWGEGAVEAKVFANGIGFFLKSLFGTATSAGSTGSSGTVFGHTFTVLQNSQHPSLTISLDDPNGDRKYPNGVIGKFELKAVSGEFVKFTSDILSKQGATGTVTSSGSFTNDYEFTGKDVVLKLADTSSGLAAASAIAVKSVSLVIEPNITREQTVGSTSPNDILNKQFSAELEMELLYQDTTYLTLVEAATNKFAKLQIKDTTVDMATGASVYNPELSFTFDKVQVIEHETNSPNDDFVTQTVKMKALFNSTTSKMVTVFLRNTRSAYIAT
jgi:hypothetical protein